MDSFYMNNTNNSAYGSEHKLSSGPSADSKHDISSKMSHHHHHHHHQAVLDSRNPPRRRASKSSYYGHRAKRPSGGSFSSSSDKSEYNWPFGFGGEQDGPTGPSQGRSSDFDAPACESTPSQRMLLREIGAALTL